mmetsp:Transcript_30272/g.88555  ORF Transcript_30272/g.88555 Transcript_30272/m.88555 type:complete len:217 (-) Transcript_30272:200-850(-)
MSCTPRWLMVRAASTSCGVDISSTMITSGLWFSTASRIRVCCKLGLPTGIQRALPMAGWGSSPSPAISHVLSTTTTFSRLSSAKVRAISRRHVVFPTPGRPMSSNDCLRWAISIKNVFHAMVAISPLVALPTRTATPKTFSGNRMGCVIKLIRCNVPAMPRRLVVAIPLLSSLAANRLANSSTCPSVHAVSNIGCRTVAPVRGSAKMHSGICPSWR